MMLLDLQIDSPYQNLVEVERLKAVLQTVFQLEALSDVELTVVITSDEAVRELNRQYRGEDKPTDVLSFEAGGDDEGFILPPESTPYIGDLIISAPTAEKQAMASGHLAAEEILLLVIHGALHLLGYDHGTADEKAAMWQRQAEILTRHQLSHVTPTA
jgi:probable rRNA maturation factor